MIPITWCVLVLSVMQCMSSTEGARILCVVSLPSPSHYFLGNKLLRELAARGHEVTMVSPYKNKEPIKNYRQIVFEGLEDLTGYLPQKYQNKTLLHGRELPSWLNEILASYMGSGASELALKNRELQNLLNSDETFDLIIIEFFFSELLYGIAHRFDCPVLILSPIGSSTWTNALVGNPSPNSYVPNLFMPLATPFSFVERLQNAVHNVIVSIHRQFVYSPWLNAQFHQYFPGAPPLEELILDRTALVLLNSHPSFADARPHVPNMIEIGGFHIDEPKPLPNDLKEFMDNAEHGVILFSMGSNLKSRHFNNDTISAILKSFGKLKETVIWKLDDAEFASIPANVRIMEWCPQNDILAHPNLKLYITHGGMLSTTEAVYHGVPMIGIPIYFDQLMNVASSSRKGFAIQLDYEDISEDTFTAALHTILNNPKFSKNVKFRSQLLRDRPVRPIDAAVYWTEYVIKYKGAKHLRSPALLLNWFQLYSIDLIVFVISIGFLIFLVLYYVVKKLLASKDRQIEKRKKN